MLIAAHESQQHTFAAAVLQAYARLLERAPNPLSQRLRRDLAEASDIVDDIPSSPQLRRARQAVEAALAEQRSRPSHNGHLSGELPRTAAGQGASRH